MPVWKKKYHELYQKSKSEFDPKIIEWVAKKEDIVCAAPLNNPLLKHDFPGIRRYKTGKIRILYALSTERQDLWESPPSDPEICFLYVDLKSDNTYTESLKALRKHQLV